MRGNFVQMAALLTVRDVADELRVNTRTVRALIASGELRAMHGLGRGAGYRIRREWLETFLRAREVRTTEDAHLQLPAPRSDNRADRRRHCPAFRSIRDARVALGLIRGGKS